MDSANKPEKVPEASDEESIDLSAGFVPKNTSAVISRSFVSLKALPKVLRFSSYSWKVFGEMYGVRLASQISPASGKSISASSAVSMYQGFSLCVVFDLLSADVPQEPEGNQRVRKCVICSHTRQSRCLGLVANQFPKLDGRLEGLHIYTGHLSEFKRCFDG